MGGREGGSYSEIAMTRELRHSCPQRAVSWQRFGRILMKAGFKRLVLASLCVLLASAPSANAADEASVATPAEFVATYDSLATAILATKQAEENLVRSILSTTYAHASAARARALRAIEAGDNRQAQVSLEELAALVAQLGNEGDNAVAGIRKRLVEGGHHHNAEGETKGIYDPGFVIVTRAAKQKLLTSSRNIAQLARKPDVDAIAREWTSVSEVWAELVQKKN